LGIEWYRDLGIALMGFISTIVFIFLGIVTFLCYRQWKATARSVKQASDTVTETVGIIRDEAIRPVFKIAAMVDGIKAGIEKIMELFASKNESQGGGRNVGQ